MSTSFLSRNHTELWWAVRFTFYIVWQIPSWNEVHHCEMSWLIKNFCWICAHLWDRGSFSWIQGRVEWFTAFLAGDLGDIWATLSGKPALRPEVMQQSWPLCPKRPKILEKTQIGMSFDTVKYCERIGLARRAGASFSSHPSTNLWPEHTWTVGNHSSDLWKGDEVACKMCLLRHTEPLVANTFIDKNCEAVLNCSEGAQEL